MWGYRKKPKLNAATIIIVILILLLTLLYLADRQLAPMITEIAKQNIQQKATAALHTAAKKQILLHQDLSGYTDLMQIEKDDGGRIVLLAPKTAKINLLIADITLEAESLLEQLESETIAIPLGSLFGSKLLASLGPNLKLHIRPIGDIKTEYYEEFSAAGINQTRHRLCLKMTACLRTAIPFEAEEYSVSSTVLLTEGIVMGEIPNTYLNVSP